MPTRQPSLFGDAAPWEEDDAQLRAVATVVFARGPAGVFDYLVPPAILEKLRPVCRVRVPLGGGNRSVVGYCVRVANVETTRRLKPVSAVLDAQPLLTEEMLRGAEWLAQRYLCDLAQVLETVLPAGVRGGAGWQQTLFLRPSEDVAEGAAAGLDQLKLPEKQRRVLERALEAGRGLRPAELAEAAGCTQAPIAALRKKGLLVAEKRRVRTSPEPAPAAATEKHLTLNADQQSALDAILSDLEGRRHRTTLLHGVTGSGKTEVYIQAIERVLQFGRQAIVLVPEISLTPQTRQRFRARFGDVALLHSHLSDAERSGHWERIARGEASVVVGARSAIFAPTPHLGLIVLDEEHETTFKQETSPRYHAREVALWRAREEGVPLVLGSATPSLETWRRAQTGEFRLQKLPRRVFDRPLPKVEVVDLRNEADRRFRSAISRPLELEMKQTLGRGGQVILLLNRRGYNTHIQCQACGAVVRCPECDIALTHHRDGEMALCHWCDYESPSPTRCPECDFRGIRFSGLGTQRLEAEVRAMFPEHECLRMDTDTMRKPGAHERALAAFREGLVRILLGTQMIAKGLDFPNVTLVGVIRADAALHFPDFRAAERTFQLLVQVAGRTGRGASGGRVLVQTLTPEHPAIQAAAEHDYERFARDELPMREALSYPPYAAMVRAVIRGPVEAQAQAFAEQVAERLSAEAERRQAQARVLGPAPCPFPKLRGNYRFQVQGQAADEAPLHEAIREVWRSLKAADGVQWIVDVDPIDML